MDNSAKNSGTQPLSPQTYASQYGPQAVQPVMPESTPSQSLKPQQTSSAPPPMESMQATQPIPAHMQTPFVSSPPPHHLGIPLKLIIGAAVLVLVILGGVFYLTMQNTRNAQEVVKQTPNPTPPPVLTPTPTPSMTNAALDTDMQNIDQTLGQTDQDITGVAKGLNDQPTNLN